jgi:hypothetical protein
MDRHIDLCGRTGHAFYRFRGGLVHTDETLSGDNKIGHLQIRIRRGPGSLIGRYLGDAGSLFRAIVECYLWRASRCHG